ncbi:MAG: cytochrome P450 [bacterium]
MGRLDEIINQLLRERLGREKEYRDFLSMLLLARDEGKEQTMNRQMIRDECVSFLIAGHETTASVLTWTFYLLIKNHEYYRRIHQEAKTIFEDDQPDFERSVLDNLNNASRTFKESLRLYPSVPVFGRAPVETRSVGPYRIPAGVTLIISSYVLQRRSTLWDQPDVFRPERFEDGRSTEHSFSYIPFSAGAHMCTGKEFALMEGPILISLLSRDVRFEPLGNLSHPGLDTAVNLEPADPVKLKVEQW